MAILMGSIKRRPLVYNMIMSRSCDVSRHIPKGFHEIFFIFRCKHAMLQTKRHFQCMEDISSLASWASIEVITVRKRSCGKVMFSQACVKNSVHKGGGVANTPPLSRHLLGRPPPLVGRHPSPGQTPPGQTDNPPGQTPPRQTPPSAQHTATAADGTHPIGMHSCWNHIDLVANSFGFGFDL